MSFKEFYQRNIDGRYDLVYVDLCNGQAQITVTERGNFSSKPIRKVFGKTLREAQQHLMDTWEYGR